jgi:hypothetical protein
MFERMIKASRLIAATLLLLGCSNMHPSPVSEATAQVSSVSGWQAEYAALAAGGKIYKLDASQSVVSIYVFRAGAAAMLGHNHVLNAPQFSGYAYLPDGTVADARFDMEFRLNQLSIDDPSVRASLGDAFSSTVTPGARQRTREHMLGADNLQATYFPYVRIHSLQIRGERPKLAGKVEIELHGQRREMWLPLNVASAEDRLLVTGSFVLRQSDFGVRPYSVLGGFLAVQDELVIEFTLQGDVQRADK